MQENLQAYVKGEINASSRRILFTKWVGEAWEEVTRNQEVVVCSFEKVGITVPIDGSGDHKINIQGLEDYHVEDSTSDEDPFADSSDESETEEKGEDDDNEDEEEEDNEDEEEEDNEDEDDDNEEDEDDDNEDEEEDNEDEDDNNEDGEDDNEDEEDDNA